MFQFLSIFGPASITYLLMHQILSKDRKNIGSWFNDLVEFICCATVDGLINVVLIDFLGRVEYFIGPNGATDFQYKGTAAFAISMVVGVIVAVIGGFIISIVKKHIDFTIEVELRKSEETHESGKDS